MERRCRRHPFRSYLKDLLQVHGIILELGQGIVKERS